MKHEIPQENIVAITFDDEKTSIDEILVTLKKNELTVKGTPVLIK